MSLFDFFKSESKNPSLDLSDFKFLSDDHTRYENGRPTNSNNKGAWRGIRVKSSDNSTFFVTMYNMVENHPIWGDNIQMAEKRMKFQEEDNLKIILRGVGTDQMGASFADYGLTLHKSSGNVNKVTLHMFNRSVDIIYDKAGTNKSSERMGPLSDFEKFKIFNQEWKTKMPMAEKMRIAMESDTINNRGSKAYRNDEYEEAIEHFEHALSVMPINTDALHNLKLCYSEIGDYKKSEEMASRLDYLKS